MTFDKLEEACTESDIDTVLACFVDMQGRLVGKRFHEMERQLTARSGS